MKRLFLAGAAILVLAGCNADGSVDWTAVGDAVELTAAVAVITEVAIDPDHPISPVDDERCRLPRRWERRTHDGRDWWTCIEDRR